MSTQNASPNITNSANEVTVVFKARSIHSVAIIAGVETNGEFKPFREGFAANIRPDAEYVVAQLPVRTQDSRYAITQVMLKAGGTAFDVCSWKKALAFPSYGGRVIYLGDFNFRENNRQLAVEHSVNIESARSFIDGKYPNLRGLTEYVEPVLMSHAKTDCESRAQQYQIYFIPVRR